MPIHKSKGDQISGAKIGVRAVRLTDQSIANDIKDNVEFDAADVYDYGDMHDIVTNNDRVVIPAGEAGLYHIVAGGRWGNNSNGYRLMRITKNDTSQNDGDSVKIPAVSGSSTRQNISTVFDLIAGDYVSLEVRHTAGVAIDIKEAMLTVTRLFKNV